MCGILVLAWSDSSGVRQGVLDSLPTLIARGKDAWGVALGNMNNPNTQFLLKLPRSIGERKSKKKLMGLFDHLPNSGWALIHSRLATDGYSGIKEHNHPITTQNITLIHNGLVTEWPPSLTNMIDETSTDSQNLTNLIHAVGSLRADVYLNEIQGEVTIAWHDRLDNKVRVYSNVGGLYKLSHDSFSAYVSEPPSRGYSPSRIPSRKVVEV